MSPAAAIAAAPPAGGPGSAPTVAYALDVDAEGRVILPGTRPGDHVRVTVAVIERSPVPPRAAPNQTPAADHSSPPDEPPGPDATTPGSSTTTETADFVPIHLRSPEEKAAVMAEVLAAGHRVRETATDAWMALDHGDWLYDKNGWPK